MLRLTKQFQKTFHSGKQLCHQDGLELTILLKDGDSGEILRILLLLIK